MSERVTLVDVAAHAGVSRATASLVLRGTGRVSDETRARVEASMAALGYIYDRGAAALRTQRLNAVGVLVTNVSNPIYAEFIDGLETALAARRFVTIVANTGKDRQRQDELITALREQRVAGLTIAAAEGTEAELAEYFRASGIKHVFIGSGSSRALSSSVGFDDTTIGYIGAAHLIDVHGCRRLAYVGGPAGYLSRDDRAEGIRAALIDRGLDPDDTLHLPAPSVALRGYEHGMELLRQPVRPDGIFCHTDMVALGMLRAIFDGAPDWRPPVIGNGNVEAGTMFEPPLTTISSDASLLGREAARMLFQQFDDEHAEPEHVRPEPHVVVRRSCGCGA